MLYKIQDISMHLRIAQKKVVHCTEGEATIKDRASVVAESGPWFEDSVSCLEGNAPGRKTGRGDLSFTPCYSHEK